MRVSTAARDLSEWYDQGLISDADSKTSLTGPAERHRVSLFQDPPAGYLYIQTGNFVWNVERHGVKRSVLMHIDFHLVTGCPPLGEFSDRSEPSTIADRRHKLSFELEFVSQYIWVNQDDKAAPLATDLPDQFKGLRKSGLQFG
jgi:hypothetical protein